jgi:hypothetical protein
LSLVLKGPTRVYNWFKMRRHFSSPPSAAVVEFDSVVTYEQCLSRRIEHQNKEHVTSWVLLIAESASYS